jgi:hypothetical protein
MQASHANNDAAQSQAMGVIALVCHELLKSNQFEKIDERSLSEEHLQKLRMVEDRIFQLILANSPNHSDRFIENVTPVVKAVSQLLRAESPSWEE